MKAEIIHFHRLQEMLKFLEKRAMDYKEHWNCTEERKALETVDMWIKGNTFLLNLKTYKKC